MKALSLTQPWATLVAIGAKRIETRSWETQYRGLVAIHATKTMTGDAHVAFQSRVIRATLSAAGFLTHESLPKSAIVAVARIVDCASTSHPSPYYPDDSDDEICFGDYGPDRWMWVLEGVQRLPDPVPCRGHLSLWQIPDDVLARVLSQIGAAS